MNTFLRTIFVILFLCGSGFTNVATSQTVTNPKELGGQPQAKMVLAYHNYRHHGYRNYPYYHRYHYYPRYYRYNSYPRGYIIYRHHYSPYRYNYYPYHRYPYYYHYYRYHY